jgi:hypothetical protein
MSSFYLLGFLSLCFAPRDVFANTRVLCLPNIYMKVGLCCLHAVCLWIPPIVARQWLGKDFPTATRNCLRRHFLCSPCRVKGKYEISFSKNLLIDWPLVITWLWPWTWPSCSWGIHIRGPGYSGWGTVRYLHRSPASRKRPRKGNPGV